MMDKPIHTVLISMIRYKKKDNLKLVYRFFYPELSNYRNIANLKIPENFQIL